MMPIKILGLVEKYRINYDITLTICYSQPA